MWEAIVPAGRKAAFRMMAAAQLSLVTHRQLIFPITRGKYKAVQSISVQRQGCTVYNVQRHKGLVKSPEVLTETHFLQATGLNADMCSLLYEKLSWCSVRDDASRNEPKVFFPTQHLPEAQDVVFSSQKDKEDCSFSVIHAPSMTATCRITFSVCFGFVFPGPDLQKY